MEETAAVVVRWRVLPNRPADEGLSKEWASVFNNEPTTSTTTSKASSSPEYKWCRFDKCLVHVARGAILLNHPDAAFGGALCLPLLSQTQAIAEAENDVGSVHDDSLSFADFDRWRVLVDPWRLGRDVVEVFRPLPPSWSHALTRSVRFDTNTNRDGNAVVGVGAQNGATVRSSASMDDDKPDTAKPPGSRFKSSGLSTTLSADNVSRTANLELERSLIPESLVERFSIIFPSSRELHEFMTACSLERGEQVDKLPHETHRFHRRKSTEGVLDAVEELIAAPADDRADGTGDLSVGRVQQPVYPAAKADDAAAWLHLVLSAARPGPGKFASGVMQIAWHTPSGQDVRQIFRELTPKHHAVVRLLKEIKEAVLSHDASALHERLAAETIATEKFDKSKGGILVRDIEAVLLTRFALCLPLDAEGNTALHLAAEEGHHSVVEFVLQHCVATHQQAFALNCLLDRICWLVTDESSVSLSRADFLQLKLGFFACDINIQEARGWTALHYAASRSHLRVLKCLLVAGADASITTTKGSSSPLHYLAQQDWFAVDASTTDLKTSAATDGVTAELSRESKSLSARLAVSKTKMLRRVFDRSSPDLAEPIAHPLPSESQSCSALLAMPKVKILRRFFDRFSLDLAESLPNEVINLLQVRGNPVDALNCFGETPLQLACLDGHERNVLILLRHGADVFNVNRRGENALDYVRRRVSHGGNARKDVLVALLEGLSHFLQNFNLETFPRDVIVKIFGYLSLSDLVSCAQVCHTFKENADDNALWEEHYRYLAESADAAAATVDPGSAFVELASSSAPAGCYAREYRRLMINMSSACSLVAPRSLNMPLFRVRGANIPSRMLSDRPSEEGFRSSVSSTVEHDYLFKLVLVGDDGVGKSSFCLRHADDSFYEHPNVGIDFRIRTHILAQPDEVPDEAKIIKLLMWDCQIPSRDYFERNRYDGMYRPSLRGVHGVFIMFDITDRQSWNNVKTWPEKVERFGSSSIRKILVGCKADLAPRRAVSLCEIESFCTEHNLVCCETSAKVGWNVDNAVGIMVEKIIWTQTSEPTSSKPPKRDKECSIM